MNTSMQGGRRSLWKGPAIVTALFLLIPLLGNTFVDDWHWDLGGFVIFGSIVFGLGLAYQLVTRNMDTLAYRAAVGLALLTAFLLFWGNLVQLSGGILTAAMYFAVLIVGLIGATLARLRPTGMGRALLVTALAQASVLVIALIIRNVEGTAWSAPVVRGFVGNACFAILFAGSAFLFRKAARAEYRPNTA